MALCLGQADETHLSRFDGAYPTPCPNQACAEVSVSEQRFLPLALGERRLNWLVRCTELHDLAVVCSLFRMRLLCDKVLQQTGCPPSGSRHWWCMIEPWTQGRKTCRVLEMSTRSLGWMPREPRSGKQSWHGIGVKVRADPVLGQPISHSRPGAAWWMDW